MKYYFIAFSLLMSASAIAMDEDQNASHFPTVQHEASNSFSDSYSDSSDGEPVFLFPISFMDITQVVEEPIYANDERPTREYIYPAPDVVLPPAEDCLWKGKVPGVQSLLAYVSKNPDSTLFYSYKTICSYNKGIDQEVWETMPEDLQEKAFKDLMEMDHNIPNLNTFLEANPHFSQFLPSEEAED